MFLGVHAGVVAVRFVVVVCVVSRKASPFGDVYQAALFFPRPEMVHVVHDLAG